MPTDSEERSVALHEAFHQIYVLLDDGDRRALRNLGLTPTQFTLLNHLANSGDASPTMTHLSLLLLCTRGNVTRLVRRMEQHGLVQSQSDPNDQRLLKVSLTSRGAERLAAAREAHRAAIRRRLAVLNADTQATLLDMLHEVAALLADDLAHQPAQPALEEDDAPPK